MASKYRAEMQEKGKRKCHDCGKATYDFRCPECWAKVRKKYAVRFDIEDNYDATGLPVITPGREE